MNQLDTINAQIGQLSADLAALEQEREEIISSYHKQVAVKRNERSLTLKFNGRTVNARRNQYGRYDVSEKGKVFIKDFPYGIPDLKFYLASGQI